MGVNKVVYGTTVLVDLTNDTVKADKLAAGVTAHDAAGNLITGVLEIVSPKIHLNQGVMYAPAASAYYRVQQVSDVSVNFLYYGGSGCEQIVYPITGLVPGCTYTIEFSETYNGGFIGDSYYYGCGIMQEAEYKATTFPVNAGKPSFITWYTASTGTQKGAHTFTAQTTKAYWVWSMARCNDGTQHNITFTVKAQASGISLQNKTVTANGTVMADSGYDGLGVVTVNVPNKAVSLQAKKASVTTNGTLTVKPDSGYDGLSSVEVTVNVESGGGGSSGGAYENSRATSVGEFAYYGCDILTAIEFLAATSVGEDSFFSCGELTSARFPVATSVGKRAFYGCKKLTTADFSASVSIAKSAFNACSNLTAVILRNGTMSTLASSDAFMSTPIFSSSGNGYIYVPASLVNTYKNADNWWSFPSKFRALESYTVDGTTTGALDPSKI